MWSNRGPVFLLVFVEPFKILDIKQNNLILHQKVQNCSNFLSMDFTKSVGVTQDSVWGPVFFSNDSKFDIKNLMIWYISKKIIETL